MKTTSEVIDAVRDGTPATEEELRYALHNVAIWHNLMVFDLARAITEDPLSAETRRGLQRAWDSWKDGNNVPLDVRLKGSSYEPGIGREESHNRWSEKTADTLVKFAAVLSGKKDRGGQ